MSRVGVFASPDEAREFKQLLLQLRAAGFALNAGQKQAAIVGQPQEFVVANTTDEIIPPFAIMQCTVFNTDAIGVQKPADRYGRQGPYLVNGGYDIPIGGRGIGTNYGPIAISMDDTSFVLMTPQRRISPEVDQWTGLFNPAGCFIYLGDRALRLASNIVFAMYEGYPQVIHAKTGSGGIPAASGVGTRTLGSAECSLWEDDGNGNYTESIPETIYNTMSTAVSGSSHILAARNHLGRLVVISEDCE